MGKIAGYGEATGEEEEEYFSLRELGISLQRQIILESQHAQVSLCQSPGALPTDGSQSPSVPPLLNARGCVILHLQILLGRAGRADASHPPQAEAWHVNPSARGQRQLFSSPQFPLLPSRESSAGCSPSRPGGGFISAH